MFTPQQVENALRELEVTHVVWVPDSATGLWEERFSQSEAVQLVRVCREGEAWAVAAGLHIGGGRPLVVIQNTGLFESGDALRNVLFDLKLPLWVMIGYRNYLIEESADTAKRFTEPILAAWGLEPLLLDRPDSLTELVRHFRQCQEEGKPGIALLAEGRG